MAQAKFPHQPTIRQLLSCEALSEAQVLSGHDLLDRTVLQVVTSLTPPPRAGSLVVTRIEALSCQDRSCLSTLSGLAIIKPVHEDLTAAQSEQSPATTGIDLELEHLTKLCADTEIPLIVIPGFGETSQPAEDVRLAFLDEVKRTASSMHAHLISLVLSDGLPGLIEQLFSWINRPMAVETADFKILAAKNMGATPPGQQSILSEQLAADVNRQLRSKEHTGIPDFALRTFRIGRRLVLPVVLDDVVAGYISVLLRPTDDASTIAEYLAPASLACMVDFSQRRRDRPTSNVTQESLLKDLLSGHSLSAADQERVERHFGFDLCDGLWVLALHIIQEQNEPTRSIASLGEPYISTIIEGTRVFVVPFDQKSGRTWQQEAHDLVSRVKKESPGSRIQLSTGRLTQTALDLSDSYREARQALIIGSMIHGENEFEISYGELGVKRLLYLMIDHPELDRFYEENLAPLEAYDSEWESELIGTLAVYLQHGANLNSAARALFIHRHTLRYRLEQIAEILKVDIDSQEVLLNLQIAFIIKDMKGK